MSRLPSAATVDSMAESASTGDAQLVGSRGATLGIVARPDFDPDRVILDQQLVAVARLTARSRNLLRPGGTASLPAARRTLLLRLGVEVVMQAISSTRAECQQLLTTAQRNAATIVREATEDVALLTSWLQQPAAPVEGTNDPTSDRLGGNVAEVVPMPPTLCATTPSMTVPARIPPVAPSAPEAELLDVFFDAPAEDEDRWAFMDEQQLAGVGRGLLRRIRRLSPAVRPGSFNTARH